MEKAKEILTVVLMLYIIAGVFVMLYQLLVWHSFPKQFGYTLLIALLALKGTVIRLRCSHREKELTKTDRSAITFWLLLSVLFFCLILMISFLLKGEQVNAFIAFLTLLLCTYHIKLINPFTRTNS